MTKEELLETKLALLVPLFCKSKRGPMMTFISVDEAPYPGQLRVTYDKYEIEMPWNDETSDMGMMATCRIAHEILEDLELQLKEYEIEDNAPTGRELRKVTIRDE